MRFQRHLCAFDLCEEPSQIQNDVEITLTCSSKLASKNKESELVCRYSSLLKLSYFDRCKCLQLTLCTTYTWAQPHRLSPPPFTYMFQSSRYQWNFLKILCLIRTRKPAQLMFAQSGSKDKVPPALQMFLNMYFPYSTSNLWQNCNRRASASLTSSSSFHSPFHQSIPSFHSIFQSIDQRHLYSSVDLSSD